MNPAHLHLALNHAPLFGLSFGFALLAAGRWRKSSELVGAGWGVLVLTAVCSVAVFLTGEPAEDFIGKFPGVSKELIHEHEEAAEFALAAAGITGGFSLLGIYFLIKSKALPNWLSWATMLLALFSLSLMARTANLGGVIRHEEIRSSTSTPEMPAPMGTEAHV